MEEVFHAANAKTALKLAHVRGVALLAIAEAGVGLAEYSPLEVKISVVGYGRAEKSQVQMMVRSLLHLPEVIASEDASRRAGRRHLPRHARSHQPQAGLTGEYEVVADTALRRFAVCAGCAAVLLFQVVSGKRPRLRAGDSGEERRGRIPRSAGRRTAAQVQAHRGRDRRGLRAGGEAGQFQAPPRIRTESGVHGDEDLPPRKGRGKDRSAVQLLRRRRMPSCCGTGSSG